MSLQFLLFFALKLYNRADHLQSVTFHYNRHDWNGNGSKFFVSPSCSTTLLDRVPRSCQSGKYWFLFRFHLHSFVQNNLHHILTKTHLYLNGILATNYWIKLCSITAELFSSYVGMCDMFYSPYVNFFHLLSLFSCEGRRFWRR